MGRIDRDQIVEAALQLLDEQGLAGVSTRKVAERLGVKSSSLYWYIRDRDELMDLLADRIVADARWPEPGSGWREQVEALMVEYLRCLMAHRDAAQVAAGRPPTGPHRLRGAETVLTALLSAGLREQEAVDAALVLTTYVVGFALERDAAREPTDANAGMAKAASPERYPTLTRLADLVRPPGPSNRFQHGLALVLDGIELRVAAVRERSGAGY
jgi:TetR/AcrR family tetracycline transcriptional repressor